MSDRLHFGLTKPPMKVCYFAIGGFSLNSGIHQKISATTRLWQQLGANVIFSLGARQGSEAEMDARRGILNAETFWFWSWRNGITRVYQEYLISRRIQKWRPDIVYLRNAHYSPGILPLIKAAPTIIELNTKDDVERRGYGFPHYAYFRLSTAYLYPRASGFVAVTKEISAIDRIVKTEKPITVISNGISLKDYNVLPPSAER